MKSRRRADRAGRLIEMWDPFKSYKAPVQTGDLCVRRRFMLVLAL
jgi:hypothetical protein